MGYRHQVISDTMVLISERWPVWFIEKYEPYLEFDWVFWVSRNEYKRYSALKDLEKDIQRALKEMDINDSVRLIFFADESDEDSPDVSHVTITKDKIVELRPDGWIKTETI